MNKPLSQELFDDMYTKMDKKVSSIPDTIFENISVLADKDKNYNRFMSSPYSKMFYLEESTYQKNLVIKSFIENEILSEIFTEAYDAVSAKYNDNELSFKENLLFENTVEAVNVKYKGQLLEEGFADKFFDKANLFGKTALIGAAAAMGSLPLSIFASSAVFGLSILLPSRSARNWDMYAEKALGVLGGGLIGTKSLFALGNTSVSQSNNNILNFDNIDTNPDVKKLFYSLARTRNKKDTINALGAVVQGCLDNNDPLNSTDVEESHNNYFKGLYTPRNNNVFTVALESIFKHSGDDKSEGYGTLIQYRKCLSDKLVDMYKFLMIANISTNKDYKKITNLMKKGFADNPEHILSFLSDDTESEQLNKENILLLTKFRIFLGDLSKDLKKGIFDADKEAGTYLTQKLKNVDSEVEEYVSNHQRQIETNFEDEDDFRRKDFKFNQRPERDFKKKLMDKNVNFNNRDDRDNRDDKFNNRDNRDDKFNNRDNRDDKFNKYNNYKR